MPIPLALALGTTALSAGISGYNAYRGSRQKAKAKAAMEALDKPVFNVPEELLENLSDAERRTVEGLPAAQKKQWVQNLERSRQSSLSQRKDFKSGLVGLQESTSLANDQYTNLLSMDAAALESNKQRKESAIERARTAVSAARERKFGYDNADYQAQLTAEQANYQAGARNQNQGIMQMAAAGIDLAGSGALGSGSTGSSVASTGVGTSSTNANTLFTGGNSQNPLWGGTQGWSKKSNFNF